MDDQRLRRESNRVASQDEHLVLSIVDRWECPIVLKMFLACIEKFSEIEFNTSTG
jgi:hypothetical protein